MENMIDEWFMKALKFNSHDIMCQFFGMIRMAYMLDGITMDEFDFLIKAGTALDGDLI